MAQCCMFLLQELDWNIGIHPQNNLLSPAGRRRQKKGLGLKFPISYLLIIPCKQGAFQNKEIFTPVSPTSHSNVCIRQYYFCGRLALDASTTKPPHARLLIRQSNVKLMDSPSGNGPTPLACNTHVHGKHCSPHRAEVTLHYLPKSKSGQGFWQSCEQSPPTLPFPGNILWMYRFQQYPQLNATGNNVQDCPMSIHVPSARGSPFKAWGDLNSHGDSKPTSSCPGNAPTLKLSLIPCAKTSAPQGPPRKSRRWRDLSSWNVTQSCTRLNQDNFAFFGPHFSQAAQKQQQIEQHETPQHSV